MIYGENVTIIQHKIDLLVSLFDATTGRAVETIDMDCFKDGEELKIVKKDFGLILINSGRLGFDLTVKARGYEDCTVKIEYEKLDETYPEKILYLLPKIGMNNQDRFVLKTEKKDELVEVIAIKNSDMLCAAKEYEARKRVLSLFNPHGKTLDEKRYALINPEIEGFEEVYIKSSTINSAVLLNPPEMKINQYCYLSRIIEGKVSENSEYKLVLPTLGDLKYCVKFVYNDRHEFETMYANGGEK